MKNDVADDDLHRRAQQLADRLRPAFDATGNGAGPHLADDEPPHADWSDEPPSEDDAPRDEDTPSTWTPINLTDTSGVTSEPTVGLRTDGQALLYPGCVHWLAAEPEAGKTWLGIAVAAQEVNAGHRVLIIDYETSAASTRERLIALGLDVADLARITYISPSEPLRTAKGAFTTGALSLAGTLAEHGPYTLAIIDAATEALAAEGLDDYRGAEVAQWIHTLPRYLADGGAAVLVHDHVTKDRDDRGRWAIGSGHKLAGADAAFTLTVTTPFRRGGAGMARLDVAKDRHGHLRAGAAGRVIGEVHLTETAGRVTVTVEPPADSGKPTVLMARVVDQLQRYPGSSGRDLRALGHASTVDRAVRELIDEGTVIVQRDGSAHRHYLTGQTP